MQNDYMLVLSGHNIFREIELPADIDTLRIGTTAGCDIRFRREALFSSFELELTRDNEGNWAGICSEEVYFADDSVRKLAVHKFKHGDRVCIKYAESDVDLFTASFQINFEQDLKGYDRLIDLSVLQQVSIGGAVGCNLQLSGPYVAGDQAIIRHQGAAYSLTVVNSRYGVCVDGLEVTGTVPLKDKSFISLANYYFYLSGGKLYCSKSDNITFQGVKHLDAREKCETSDYPRFNRNTRVVSVMDDEPISVMEPPQKPEKPRGNIALQLMPAIGMLAVVIVVRGFLMSSSNSSFILFSVCSIALGIITSVVGIIEDRRDYKKETKEREEKYNAYIDKKREEVEGFRQEELGILNEAYPTLSQELGKVRDFSGDLFERRLNDGDFLDYRMGTGSYESVKPVDYKERETFDVDELAELPAAVRDDYKCIEDAPLALKLKDANAVGVVGSPANNREVLKSMVVDIATHQYATDVRIFFVVEPENEPLIHWARVLPHVVDEQTNSRNIVCDDESKAIVFDQLFKELTRRSAMKEGEAADEAHLVIFVVDECGLSNHPLCRFVDMASSLGATFIFFDQHKELLPMGCTQLLILDDEGRSGTVIPVANAYEKKQFTYETISDAEVAEIATTLAPVYCEEVSLESALTSSISLFEMFDIMSAEDLDLETRWASSVVYKSLAAPIGVSKSKVIYLDLGDKAHGPHGLVAGTTGSGKSEILQTYILSMATIFHPYEIGFMIIDFKGGGMVNQFRDLPHLMGAITNIDGREIDRSLKSIKAELKKRQRYFADADVNHINNYIKKYKAGEVKEPLPHLIIIVDEFAELKAEQPEFMKELISAARIGRSLGVHLILATQKPSGQVSEQIWSNSRFKLCLKVASKEDSNEVIKSPLAAEIKEAGRAYLQVGNNEIFELFQSAYSGAPEHEDDQAVKEFTLYEVENSGRRVPVYQKRRSRSDKLVATQLEAIVGHVASHCNRRGIKPLPGICLPSVPDVVSFPDDVRMDAAGRYALGFYDDPDGQYQGPAYFDLDNANTFVVGASQMGKTNILQSIIRSVASVKTPAEAVFYIMDFGSMILKNFEGLNHVGGVVLSSEDERMKNLFRLLRSEMATRKKKLLAAGVSSFSSYVEAGNTDMPHIYLLMDNFAVFKELYGDAYGDELQSLSRDGLAYGLTMVVTNNSSVGFGYRYMSNFSQSIALTCNDTGDYNVVFDRCRMTPKNVPGRALISMDKEIYEMQSYLCFEGEKEIERISAMRSFMSNTNARNEGVFARCIPAVPDELDVAYINNNYELSASKLAVAMDYSTVAPVDIDLDSQFSMSLIGGSEDTRGAFLRAILNDLKDNAFERSVEMYIVDDMLRSLRELEDLPFVETYTNDFTMAEGIMEDIADKLDDRRDLVMDEGMDALKSEPYLVVVFNSIDAINALSQSKELTESYKKMKQQCSTMKVLFVFANIPNAAVPFNAALLKELKDEKKAFLFENMADVKFFDFGLTANKAFPAPLEDAQAFRISGADISKIKYVVAQ